MAKIKVQPMTATKGVNVKDIGKNISDIISFMFSVVNDTNRVIVEINDTVASMSDESVKELKQSVTDIKKSIPDYEQYDDSWIRAELSKIISVMPVQYDDSQVTQSIVELKDTITELSTAMTEVKKVVALNQAEIRSYRNITGSQLDEMRRKLDKLTEVK